MKNYISSEVSDIFEPNIYISFVCTLNGNISKEALYKAIECAYKNNQTTMSKIVLEQSGKAFYETMPHTGCKIFYDTRPWQDIIHESENKTFDINQGELIRSYIIDSNDDITLLIHAHHLVGDGMSVMFFLNDILQSLDGKKLNFKPMILIDKNYLDEKIKLKFYIKRFLKRINNEWIKQGKSFSWNDYYAIHKAYWESHTSFFECETYNVNKLKSNCGNNTTLNSFLITKLLRENPDAKTIGIPISIRDGNKSMSNQTSGITIDYKYKTNKSFEYNLNKIHRKIHRKINDNYEKYFVLSFMAQIHSGIINAMLLYKNKLFDNKLISRLTNILGYSGKRYSDLGVTNLKNIDITQNFDTFTVKDILFIPPKVSYTEKVIGISTFADRLTVCKHIMKINNNTK